MKPRKSSAPNNESPLPWKGRSASFARKILNEAFKTNRPVVLLLGAGLSADSGIPLASQLSQYLVQVSAMLRKKEFASSRAYLEEMRWPSRHDLRVDLMLEYGTPTLSKQMREAERLISQGSLVSELRAVSPTFAFALDEIFGQLKNDWRAEQLAEQFGALKPLAENLAKRVPRNVAYRSLLFHLCENSQALIDACLDHFIRDRAPTTTHQFITFLTQVLRSKVILSTNFDPLVERAFAAEGIIPRVYEIQGEGTIPSANMLLSQQFSIVKLHGGAHQMRTGFDLDDPLSPAVLASFYELFDRLRRVHGKQPLILVMGYSGSDRRVMDIVSTHIKQWKIDAVNKPDERAKHLPCVLWVSRDGNPPPLLKSAVDTHPQVLLSRHQQDSHPEEGDDELDETYARYPVHLVRYQEARLFMLEAYQDMMRSFPISKLHYQAVNFVPHATPRHQNNEAAVNRFKKNFPDWKVALITSNRGGGSSSELARLADGLDNEYRVIWIDTAEVPSVSALIDVLCERISKCDYRLRPIRRPLLLYGTLRTASLQAIDHKTGLFTCPDLRRVEQTGLEVAVRWIQHALRRSQYFIAFDSMDEFPGDHPALLDARAGSEADLRSKLLVLKERRLVKDFIFQLVSEADKIGDSRIGFAMAGASLRANRPEQTRGPVTAKTMEQPYHDIRRLFQREHRRSKAVGLLRLPGSSSASTNLNVAKAVTAIQEGVKERFSNPDPRTAIALILSVASCNRRIRSELLLARTCARILAAAKDIRADGFQAALFHRTAKGADFQTPFINLLWKSRDNQSSRATGDADETDVEAQVVNLIRIIAGDCDPNVAFIPSRRRKSLRQDLRPRWFYRVEGGYHWMHRDIRDRKYREMRKANPLLPSLLHHRMAEFCHDDIYYRSNDARAFLEYLFHRTAAIRLLISAKDKFPLTQEVEKNGKKYVRSINATLAVEWIERVARTLQREKSALLTRVRLPSLISQLRILLRVCRQEVYPATVDEPDNLRERLRDASAEILAVLGDLLLSAGHPHAAVDCQLNRLELLLWNKNSGKAMIDFDELDQTTLAAFITSRNTKQLRAKVKEFHAARQKGVAVSSQVVQAISDLVNAVQDPLLFIEDIRCADAKKKPDWCKIVCTASPASNPTRKQRIDWIGDCHKILREIWMYAFRIIRHGSPSGMSDTDIDLSRTLHKRYLEFELLQFNAPILDTIRLYDPSFGKAEPPGEPTEEVQKDFTRHIWRVTGRSSRHECYRLCLRARLLALRAADEDWAGVWSLFRNAEAVLDRQGGPADLQALAITRLLHADHRVRNAERLWLKEIEWTKNPAAEPPNDALRMHEDAVQLLSSIEGLLAEGRGENRWRFQHLLTQARCHMFRARRGRYSSQVKSMEEYLWAGRNLAGALSNCGKWTDRRYVLTAWWTALKKSVLQSSDENGQSRWDRMCARMGVKWDLKEKKSARKTARRKPSGRKRK